MNESPSGAEPFDFRAYNAMLKQIKDPRNKEFIETDSWKEYEAQMREGYRRWLNQRRIDATVALDVSTEEGLNFLREVQGVVDFIMRKVKPFTEEDGSNLRAVKLKYVFDEIEIRITSKPRFRGSN